MTDQKLKMKNTAFLMAVFVLNSGHRADLRTRAELDLKYPEFNFAETSGLTDEP